MLHRRELFRLLAGAPVAAFAAQRALAAPVLEVLVKEGAARPLSTYRKDFPSFEEIADRLLWVAKEASVALAVTAGPTLSRFRTVSNAIGLDVGDTLRFGDLRVEMKHHINATQEINGSRLFDDEYARHKVKCCAVVLAAQMASIYDDAREPWSVPELIVFSGMPTMFPGTGAVGGWAAYQSVLTRAVLSFDPATLSQTLSIDSAFGLA